ncbi:Ribosomal RNA small subunit methyltransferase D [Mannheimia haemolytica]|nr:Ribosomal RNA small subunit methyltransferase D [Mannheimia haemolytica]
MEKFANAANQLKKNLQALKSEQGSVIHTDTLAYLAQKNNGEPFNIVFIDPPFHQGFVPQVLNLLAENNWLAPNAILYVETEKNHPPLELPQGWQILKEKAAGMVVSRLIQL